MDSTYRLILLLFFVLLEDEDVAGILVYLTYINQHTQSSVISIANKHHVHSPCECPIVKVYNVRSLQCKGMYWVFVLCLVYRQLRFSLYSGNSYNKVLTLVVFLYYPSSLALWSILCFMPLAQSPAVLSGDDSAAQPVLVALLIAAQLVLMHSFQRSSACLKIWAFAAPFIQDLSHCTLGQPSGLCALWDSLSSFPSQQIGRCTLGWSVWPVVG